ncbi:MAG: TraB/GumN family protein [Cryomorphaceae bacterium]|nr:TraB/GumN family protein [Flavobacteriales bacterium]
MKRKKETMKGKALISLLAGLMFIPALAQNLEESLLWKVEGKGIKTSHLFGTVHMLPKEKFELKDKVKAAISESDVMVMELDFSDPNISMQMMNSAMMTGDETVGDFLSEDQFRILDSILIQTAGVSLMAVQKLKPFMISSMLIQRFVGSEPASFEGTLTQMAMSDSMPIIGLETVAEQMAVFDSISYRTQARGLIELIEDEDEVIALYDELIEAYRSEDLNALYDLILQEMHSPEEEGFMLTKRNKAWIGDIGEIAKEDRAFIAVGAGHLAGSEGVIELLRVAGYRVSPVLN